MASEETPPASVGGDRGCSDEHRLAFDEIHGSVQLVTVELMTLAYEVPPLFRVEPAEARSFELSDEVESYHFEPSLGRVAFVFKWNVGISVSGDGPPAKLSCVARYLVLYEGVPPEARPDIVRPCTERLGRFAAYPYLRALTSRLFAESQLDVPLLPILREGNRPRAKAGATATLNQRQPPPSSVQAPVPGAKRAGHKKKSKA